MLRRLEERLSWPRSKTATDAAEPQPSSSSPSSGRRKLKGSEQQTQKVASAPSEVSTNADNLSISTGSGYNKHISSNSSSSSGGGGGGGRRAISFSSHSSLSSLRESLPENPNIYDISEIRAATNKFLSKRHTSSSSLPSWRCTLRGKEVVIFQRKFHRPTTRHTVREKLSSVCKSHHNSIVKLLGVSVSGEYLYLVYEYVPGLSLAECLRNPNNPSFTVLSSWMSRIQIATDLAGGLDYIHHNTGLKNVRLVHNHIRSSSVIVVEHQREKENFSYSAKICHFGTAELCGEAVKEDIDLQSEIDEIKADDAEGEDLPPNKSTEKLVRSSSVKFQGTTGYMSPEFQYTGTGTLKSDVYAFGVVILELLSGDEPVRFKFDKRTGDCVKISIIDAAREMMEGKSGGGDRQGGLRKWLDKRLKDSFPMEVAEKLTRLALDCVNVEVDKRPDMSRVARKISKLYLESKNWADKINLPSDFTVSIGPR